MNLAILLLLLLPVIKANHDDSNISNSNNINNNKEEEDDGAGTPRFGNIPPVDISRFLRVAFEPHNALGHVTQNFMNFCMGAVFWITSATIYHRVNPEEPEPISYYDREEYNDDDFSQYYDGADDSGQSQGRDFQPKSESKPSEVSAIKRLVTVLRTTAQNVKNIERLLVRHKIAAKDS